MIAQDSFYAEEVEAIADCNDARQVLLFEKLDTLLKTVNRRRTACLGENAISRDSLFFQVGFAHPCFRESPVKAVPSRGKYSIGNVPSKQSCCVIQPGPEYRRRTSVVLGCTEHDDDVGSLSVIECGCPPDEDEQNKDVEQNQEREVGEKKMKQGALATRFHDDRYRAN